MIRALLYLGLVLACASCIPGQDNSDRGEFAQSESKQAIIYYLDFGFEIITPVTPDDIAENYSPSGKVDIANPDLQELLAILQDARAGSFYEYTTRVLIILPNSSRIYMDSAGGVRKENGEFELDAATLKRAEILLDRLTVQISN